MRTQTEDGLNDGTNKRRVENKEEDGWELERKGRLQRWPYGGTVGHNDVVYGAVNLSCLSLVSLLSSSQDSTQKSPSPASASGKRPDDKIS